MSKRKTPVLRFKGFHNDWEQRKLGDIVTFYRGLTYSPKNVHKTGTLVLRSSNVKNNVIINADNVYVDPKIVNSSNVKKGDLIVVVRNGSKSLLGKHAEVIRNMPNTVIGAFMTGIKTKHSNFVNALLSTELFKSEMHKNMGSTINQITGHIFSNMTFNFPKNKEQNKTGNLFKIINKILFLQERKYEELKLLKKALMQNMFANKSLYPKLRFKGFTDKWKQEKLNSIASLLNGRAYKRNELLNSGKYPVLRVGNFYTNDKWYFSNLELKTNKYAIKGDLLYTWSATFGPHIWTGKKVIYHYHIWKIILKNNVDKFFVYEFLKEDRDQLLRNTNGSTMIHITKSNMENKYISLPNKKGQKKIGNFFKKFDNLIIAQNKKYNELKFIKKFLLQNMFI
ncbi:restriction endonuclease subunit S [Lactobacillus acetotolerans]|uniref:restriction endonuclease subunit S n=3 Tax=Lactobacillus acetotolerans TaxID=1600 RepID=UPI0012E7AE7B|nr:restriction endonuclease subunit S [Lactobacillus acetotolerans]QGV04653.1 restriction endonuclease subunit S [Lactobacillus acetotolerans]